MDKTVKEIDNKFEVGLFWKEDNIALPESVTTTLNRLTERKMDRDQKFSNGYCDKIEIHH